MRKVGLVLLLVLAVGVAGLASAQAPTGDYASGFGYWNARNASVGFEATGNIVADGEFDLRYANRSGEGKGFHAEVTCIWVEGDRAWLRLLITQSTSADPSEQVGDTKIAYAEDHGDGRGDLFNLRDEDGDATNDPQCDRDEDDEGTSIRGNIYLADEGLFARN